MAQPILLKRSSVAGKAPTTANLQYGELSINYTDGALYYLTSNNTINSFLSNGSSITSNVLTANLVLSGNVVTTQGVYWANGASYASTITGTYSNANVASYLTGYSGNISAANITVSQILYPNGTSVMATISGTYSNANVATYLVSYTGSIGGSTTSYETFGNSTTWTVPSGVTSVTALLVGGGGAGGTSTSTTAAGGGAGGNVYIATTSVTPGSVITVTIGAGGSANVSAGNGGSGGTTSFGSLSALGGGGGQGGITGDSAGGAVGVPNAGGNAGSSTVGAGGGAATGTAGATGTTNTGGRGNSGPNITWNGVTNRTYGGAGGGGGWTSGGQSGLGAGSGAISSSYAASNGGGIVFGTMYYGTGGGGGAGNFTQGGNGSAGIVRISYVTQYSLNTLNANSLIINSNIVWGNGVNYSTTVPGTYSNANVASYLSSGSITSYANIAGPLVLINNTAVNSLQITGTAAKGGAGYHDFMSATNRGGGTNPTKYFRLNSTGGFEIINNAYSQTIFSVDDGGNTTVAGDLTVGTSNWSGAWTTYTPTWTADSVAPAIGNGTLTGRYKQHGKTVFWSLRVVMGSTTTYGSGTWHFSLPVTAQSTNGVVCPATMLNNGVSWYTGTAFNEYQGTNNSVTVVSSASPSTSVGPTAPFTWSSGCTLEINGSYESA